nr:ABC transporter substrate-binding protein [uncultured Holophaga sp.]
MSNPSPLRLLALLCAVLAAGGSAQARDVIDMAGRKVTLPDTITRIYAGSPYTNVLTYVVAPEMLIGGPMGAPDGSSRYIRPDAGRIPMPKAEPGQRGPSLEAMAALKPDFVLMKGNARTDHAGAQRFENAGIPVVYVDLDEIDNYPAAIQWLSNLVGHPERGKAMADHARRTLAEVDRAVASIPEAERVRVYYAESADGLATECDESLHADAIRRAGAKLVHECLQQNHMGMEKLRFEQVLAYNPQVILTQDAKFAEMAYADPRWQKIDAVAKHRILVSPRTPFAWFDRPPAVTRLIGIPWLAVHLYPRACRIDLKQELRDFHKLFLGVDISEADLEAWTR